MDNNMINEIVSDVFSKHGLKDTSGRRKVLEYIYKQDDLFSAREIYNYMDEFKECISLKTVYNAFDLFESLGVIYKIPSIGKSQFYMLQNDTKSIGKLRYAPVRVK